MKIVIAAVGRIRGQPYADLIETYRKRILWPIIVKEIVERGKVSEAERSHREGKKLLLSVTNTNRLVALDSRGEHVSSEDFAKMLMDAQEHGLRELAFIIGGANGLDDQVLKSADQKLSFGAMTWPHLLARVMLVEQLYRATQIISGHPYHKT